MSAIVGPDAFPVAPPSKRGEPAWAIATLFSPQGEWTEEEYLALDTNRLVELVDGFLEVLPMPIPFHQLIVDYLHSELKLFLATRNLGRAFFAPMPVRLGKGKYREPDVIYLSNARLTDLHKQPEGADLVMEVVSEGEENRQRDLETKRLEYAAAGIAEYWIVDPQDRRITVLVLEGQTYREHGVFAPGEIAASVLLPGFSVQVEKAFAI
jgi:Uma2 family endonuclease